MLRYHHSFVAMMLKRYTVYLIGALTGGSCARCRFKITLLRHNRFLGVHPASYVQWPNTNVCSNGRRKENKQKWSRYTRCLEKWARTAKFKLSLCISGVVKYCKLCQRISRDLTRLWKYRLVWICTSHALEYTFSFDEALLFCFLSLISYYPFITQLHMCAWNYACAYGKNEIKWAHLTKYFPPYPWVC